MSSQTRQKQKVIRNVMGVRAVRAESGETKRRGERRGERCRLQVPAGGGEPAGTPSQALPQSVMFSATLCEKCFGPPLSSATLFFPLSPTFQVFFHAFKTALFHVLKHVLRNL